MVQDFVKIFDRNLSKLKTEIGAFREEDNLWRVDGNITNSSGNLCLHLLGNLNTYIGRNLGNTTYTRDRDAEFSRKGLSKDFLLTDIDKTRSIVIKSLENLKEEDLNSIYPENVLGYEMNTGFFLIHLSAHLSYHLGQINYLRRILE